ncbi:MAG: S49 family peptidase [Gammaproteobacteria bacterium]|nr:S49 family peptidase [Gammaproteobacteria bacterium]
MQNPSDGGSGQSGGAWERDLVNRLAFASLNEQRRARRWSVFFKSLFSIYVLVILIAIFASPQGEISLGKHTAVIEINGVISDNDRASADHIVGGLRDALKDKNTKGVVLRINSPGGSAVQAGYVYDEIKRLRKLHPTVPIYAVVTDLCASAAYYIASATDMIYVDKASLIGSIGVLMDGYGFVDTIKKLGVERRLMTAGENKGFLDPFSPMKPAAKEHMQMILDSVHKQFINAVKNGRGKRLQENPKLFSGLIWTGEQGVALGLADAFGSTGFVAREVIGAEDIADFTEHENLMDRFAQRVGAAMGGASLGALLTEPKMR